MLKSIQTIFLFIGGVLSLHAQTQEELFDLLRQQDSLVFELGYNQCDTTILRQVISDDLEFFHDQSGLLNSKEQFLMGIPNLCSMSYQATRELIDSTLQVFPLYNNGQLYGAIQNGVHEFYGQEGANPKYLTSTARFTHLWLLEGEQWVLHRILSYDHVVPKPED